MASVPRIVLVNDSSSGVTDAELENIAGACEVQLHVDLLTMYGLERSIWARMQGLRIVCAHRVAALDDDWRVEIDPNESHTEGAAFHAVRDGVPYAKVKPAPTLPIARTSRCISHECIELVCNPLCGECVELPDGSVVLFEPCDPCQYDTYKIGGVTVSNVCGPRWFRPDLPPGAGFTGRFDRMGLMSMPFELRGGYILRCIGGRWYRDSAEMAEPELIE